MYFLDTETTGLGHEADVLEYALIDINNTVIMAGRCAPVKSTSWVGAERIHGIAPEDVVGMPTWEEIYPLLKHHCAGRQVVIYNANYDMQYCRGLDDVATIYCCMLRFADYYGEWDGFRKCNRWQKLMKAADVSGFDWPIAAHNALGDAMATRHVWEWLDVVEKV